MTAVTMQSHKIVLNGLKDNGPLLEPCYGKKPNEVFGQPSECRLRSCSQGLPWDCPSGGPPGWLTGELGAQPAPSQREELSAGAERIRGTWLPGEQAQCKLGMSRDTGKHHGPGTDFLKHESSQWSFWEQLGSSCKIYIAIFVANNNNDKNSWASALRS